MKHKLFTSKYFPFFCVVLVSLVVVWPLFLKGFFVSDDGEWMVIRLTAFYQSLREGQFPVRFLGRLNRSYGYPVANFLYPGFLYVGSLFRVMGFSFLQSIKLVLIGSVLSASYILYLWLRLFFKKPESLFGALSWTMSSYLVFDMYKRGSVGEIFAFVPVFLSLYAVSANMPLVLPFSIAWLCIAHNSMMVLFLPIIILYVLLFKKYKYLYFVLLGFGMASFFILPAFFERTYVTFDSTVISKPFEYFAWGNQLYVLPALYVFIVFFYMLLRNCRKTRQDTFWLVIFIVSLMFAVPLSYPLWNLRIFSKFFQFPYRFIAVSTVAGAFITATFLSKGIKQASHKLLFIVCGLSLLAMHTLYQQKSIIRVNRDEGYYTTNEGTTTVADEYMPKWVKTKPSERASERVVFYKGSGEITYEKVSTQYISAFITAEEDSVVQINSLYYPGWGAMLDNEPVSIRYENEYGVMQIEVPSGSHHMIAAFRDTYFRFASDTLSFISISVYVGILVYAHRQYINIFGKKILGFVKQRT